MTQDVTYTKHDGGFISRIECHPSWLGPSTWWWCVRDAQDRIVCEGKAMRKTSALDEISKAIEEARVRA